MNSIVIFEDAGWRNLYPLSLSRPAFDCRVGGTGLGRRLAAQAVRAGGARVEYLCRPLLRPLVERDYPGSPVNQEGSGETLFLNGRLLCLGEGFADILALLEKRAVVRGEDEILAVRLAGPEAATYRRVLSEALEAGERPPLPRGGTGVGPPEGVRIVRYPWDLVGWNAAVLRDDFAWAKEHPHPGEPTLAAGAQIIGRERILFRGETRLEPGAILDARSGPIILGDGVHIHHHAVVLGPAYLGAGTEIKMGARLYDGVSLGPTCKMGGEVEAVIAQAYANKQHDGFLGHAYLGAWTNLGAATNNSDLKNNYSTVRVWTPEGETDTGEQFIGLFLGDHSKTAIGTRFNTGTAVGFSCNVFGDGFPAKHTRSFSWGDGRSGGTYDLERAMEVARKVMARRKVVFEAADEVLFRTLYAGRDDER